MACFLNLSLMKELRGDQDRVLSHLGAFKYYLSDIIYGSKISSEEDFHITRSLIDTFFAKEAFKGEKYNFTGSSKPNELAQYLVPNSGTCE